MAPRHLILLQIFLISLLVLPETRFPAADAAGTEISDWLGFDFINGVTPDGAPYNVSATRYEQAKSSGSTWTRWPFYWGQIEAEEGEFDYSVQDAVVNADRANGQNINAILLGTPGWASTASLETGPRLPFDVAKKGTLTPEISAAASRSTAAVPPGLNQPAIVNGAVNPNNPWAVFVHKTVSRYKDRVKVWEIWNEPDLMAGGEGVFWSGTPEEYARLLSIAYLAAKNADPSAKVLFAGLSFWSNQEFFPKALDALKAMSGSQSNNYFFDAVPWHPYISANNVIDFVQRSKSQLAARGMNKPVWINETNIPICGDSKVPGSPSCPSLFRGTGDEQASYIVQTAALSASLGVEKLLFFQLYDDNVGPSEYYGLVRNDGSPRPALSAFATVSKYFGRYSSAQWKRESKYDSVQFGGVQSAGKTVRLTVLWSRVAGSQTVQVAAASGGIGASLLDQYGMAKSGSISVSGNTVNVTLPGVTNADLALGAPVLLLEPITPDNAPPVVTLNVTTVTKCRSFDLIWSGTDNSSGVAGYDLEVRPPGAADWLRLLDSTLLTSRRYDGTVSGTYEFRVRAKDVAGNVSGWTGPIQASMVGVDGAGSDASVQPVGPRATLEYASYVPFVPVRSPVGC